MTARASGQLTEQAIAGHEKSLHRIVLGYAPANLVPAITTLAGTFVYTRLLTTGSYGSYTFVINIVMVVQAIVFFAPGLAITRFYAIAEKGTAVAGFLKTMYAVMIGLGAVTVLIVVGALAIFQSAGEPLAPATALALPLLLLRALMGTNQAINRLTARRRRYVAIECVNAVLGLLAGVLLAVAGAPGDTAVLGGLLFAALVCCAFDRRQLRWLVAPVPLDRDLLARVLRFSWPLAIAYAIGCCLQYSDRFVVGSLASVSALGVYAVAFSLVDRPITMICTAVTTGTMPLAVERYVHDGREAGRRQAGRNGAIMIALALPASVGLALASRSIAGVLVGAPFRDGVAMLIPIMAATSLLRGVSTHFIDHNFHLTQSSRTMLLVYTPFAAANLLLSALVVPSFGIVAAAYGALVCQAGATAAGCLAARRVLPLWLPRGEMVKIGTATAVMAAVLAMADPPAGSAGLLELVFLGLSAYGIAAVALNLGGTRRTLTQRLRCTIPALASDR